jgi:DNA invertase Pin-like site-specific DNA recombinase
MRIGYARSSTVDQIAGLEAQEKALLHAGCEKLFKEHVSSVDADRRQLQQALDFVREGDFLVVTRLDRLSRSVPDLLRIVEKLERKGVGLCILDFGGSAVDSKSATGKLLLMMFAAIGDFERTLMLERQRAGIQKAKSEGRYRGRAPTARRQASAVLKLHESGLGPTRIAAELAISRASVQRILRDAKPVQTKAA